MKKALAYLLLFFAVSLTVSAQKKPTVPRTGKADTVATREWVRKYVQLQLANPTEAKPVTPVLPTQAVEQNGVINLTPIKDPLLPQVQLTGNYELRYIESRPDFHLNLKLSEKNGQLYITDTGNSLQSASYTINGWTDLDNCGKLEDEPIRPYRLYHISKYSVAQPSIRETWRAMYDTPKADFRRSELFFYVVPKSETWNPVGESPMAIGRPLAFQKIPPFSLKNRTYGFEYDFVDETPARLDELDITFNRKQGKRHLKLYSSVIEDFIKSRGLNRGFHDFTEQECVDFANGLPIEKIVAFDIEPSEGWRWIIDYSAPNFARNMGIVINKLKERGALAYNWLDVPKDSPNNMKLDGFQLGPYLKFGEGNAYVSKYKTAYSLLGKLEKRNNPYSVISTGYGYTCYDYNLSPSDGNGQNISPQVTYLKALDASELWKRAWPDKEQVYFSWPFQEFDMVTFPPNHVVEIPQYNARARRTDNKPLYPPTQWEDNMILGLVNAKYLFYWSPGPVGWNPENVSSYNSAYTNGGFSVWAYEQGSTPQTGKFYVGKESMAVNATVKAAYTFSQVQNAMDGTRTAPNFVYSRQAKGGAVAGSVAVEAISDGSWFVDALTKKQPFAVVCQNGQNKVLLFQDVWSRPGRSTAFEFEFEGIKYTGQTEGNRLFIATL